MVLEKNRMKLIEIKREKKIAYTIKVRWNFLKKKKFLYKKSTRGKQKLQLCGVYLEKEKKIWASFLFLLSINQNIKELQFKQGN